MLQFGAFVLHRERMQLEENGQPVRLGSRAFELLLALVERAGEVVSHEELVARVWPTTVVEDTNLRVHIAALRKALRDGEGGTRCIANVPGRGYSFVLPVQAVAALPAPVLSPPDARPPHNLPERLTRAIGREAVVAELAARVQRRRLVTLVGPGGMGKTTVAIAVAEQCLPAFAHGARFVDLSPLSDPRLVPLALGRSLGAELPRDDPWPALRACLRDSRLLIVLDNCEHLVEAAAGLVEFVLRAAPGVHLLATSREPLDAEGEWTQRLQALALPDPAQQLDRAQTLAFPAVELFVERAAARSDSFDLAAEDLPDLRRLCRQLDGMPLAIELAAARVDGLGLRALAARLDDLFRLLNRGRRTAQPRHQTLQALLDWSHALLAPQEQVVLRRLSVFRASFTRLSAARVAACEQVPPQHVEDSLESLVAKSLVAAEPDGGSVRFRMLYTTRDYAAARLADAGEGGQLARRHALHFVDQLQQGYEDMDSMSTAGWLNCQGRMVDDVRAALSWAFSDAGDLEIGIELAAAAMHFMLFGAHEHPVPELERVHAQVSAMDPPRPLLELQLCAALCIAKGVTDSRTDESEPALLRRTSELAAQVAAPRHLIPLLHGMCTHAMGRGDYPALETVIERVRQLAQGPSEPLAVLLADRFHAMSRHYLGDHHHAQVHAQRVLEHPATHPHRHLVGQVPQAASMRALLARMHWLQGDGERAVRMADEALALCAGEHPVALSLTLATCALPIALWRGERARAEALTERLQAHASRHSQAKWLSWARNYRFVLRLQAAGAARPQLLATWAWPDNAMERDILPTFDEDLLHPATLQRVEGGVVGWCAPEVLRVAALQAWRHDPQVPPADVEALLNRSLQAARSQGAKAWERRTADSLARLWRLQGRETEAAALLASLA